MIKLKLDEMLTKRNMSAYALHINSGKRLHQSVISKIKNNDSKALQIETLDLLCELLECQPGELIAYENESATQNVNTQIVNTTQIVERATQSAKPTQSVNATQNASDNEYNLTSLQVAGMLDINKSLVTRYARDERLKGKQKKKKEWFFRESDVVEFMARRD
jgi:putative transcriptional regulator